MARAGSVRHVHRVQPGPPGQLQAQRQEHPDRPRPVQHRVPAPGLHLGRRRPPLHLVRRRHPGHLPGDAGAGRGRPGDRAAEHRGPEGLADHPGVLLRQGEHRRAGRLQVRPARPRVAAHYAAAHRPAQSQGPVVRRIGGIAVGELQPWNPRRASDFAAWGAANATYVRTDIGWKFVQPTPTTWRFDLYDRVLADMTRNHLKYLAILHTVPAWANGHRGDEASPSNLGLVTQYCYQTIKHFRPRGVVNYEIGNEVNYTAPGWVPRGAHYARKPADPVRQRRPARVPGAGPAGQPDVRLADGGPGGDGGGQEPVAFLKEAYANGARGMTSSLSFHPYGGLNPSAEPNMLTLPTTIRRVMAANGDGTDKMWATEYGLPTGGLTSWSEQVQAEWVGKAYDAWAAHPYAGPMLWYAGRDSGTSATDREQHFGILRYDGSAKPAYAALKAHLIR